VRGYPPERLLEEVAYLAYHFHWGHDPILSMTHRERQQWVSQVARINQQINQQNSDRSSQF
jgi:hypothetical protein